MHSAPVIVKGGGARVAREEMAYVGDIYGMLHAICTPHGKERWAYIPSNLLGKLQNVRGDPNSVQDFAAVDASPTAVDIYYDHDADSNTPDEWRTILVSPQGFGGTGIFALDVSDPTDGNWKVLWETTILPGDTSPATPGGGMGYAYRASLDKVKWPDVIEDDFVDRVYVGEKVWSTPTVAAGKIWVVTSSGLMEGSDPGVVSGGSSTLRQIDLDGSLVGTPFVFNKKVRGSLYVANGHLYMTTFNNEIIQLGDGDFATGFGNRVVLKSWLHH
ncbi:MAG: hypothetical protein GY850_09150 [bacterium]|nr:hypothetical protein [bacterium]